MWHQQLKQAMVNGFKMFIKKHFGLRNKALECPNQFPECVAVDSHYFSVNTLVVSM